MCPPVPTATGMGASATSFKARAARRSATDGLPSVPEVIDHGVSGYIVDDLDEAVAAIDWLNQLDRAVVRHQFERRFSVERMTRDYVQIYRSLGEQRIVPLPPPVGTPKTKTMQRVA
jgi:hypothetical protein